MKATVLSTLVIAFICSLFTFGCATAPVAGTNNGTNSVITLANATKAAVVTKTAIRSLTFIALHKHPGDAGYFKTASAAISLVIAQGDGSPESLAAALAQAPIHEVQGVEAQLAINTLQGLYEAFYADRVRASIDSQTYIRLFLAAASDGINAGLADAGAK